MFGEETRDTLSGFLWVLIQIGIQRGSKVKLGETVMLRLKAIDLTQHSRVTGQPKLIRVPGRMNLNKMFVSKM